MKINFSISGSMRAGDEIDAYSYLEELTKDIVFGKCMVVVQEVDE